MAAGNKKLNLVRKKCLQFPECYSFKNLIVVGAQDYNEPKKHAEYSNYGTRVDLWAPGWYLNKDGSMSHGSSYAAPRALSEYILYLERKK